MTTTIRMTAQRERLDLSSRTQAVVVAYESRLVSPGGAPAARNAAAERPARP